MLSVFQKVLAFFLSVLAFFGLTVKKDVPKDTYKVDKGAVDFCFSANPTTGYAWSVSQEGDSVQLTADRYVADRAAPGTAGGGGSQYYTATAVRPGKTTLTFTYARSWEGEPIRTVIAEITVDESLTAAVTSYSEL